MILFAPSQIKEELVVAIATPPVHRWTLRSTKFNNINRAIEWVVCSAPYWPAAQAECCLRHGQVGLQALMSE